MLATVPLNDVEHFVRGPDWTWYILFYFFLAGLSGGSYFLAALLRVFGRRGDEPAARVGYYVAFVAFLICPVLLTLDLGQPLRFWHMLVNTTPGDTGPVFKYWSPMSVGAWALVLFGAFVTVSFFEALARDRGIRILGWLPRLMGGMLGKLWNLVGGLLGLFIAGYTGVLLAVSNQPIWSDSWVVGGLFLASGLTGSAALLAWLVHRRTDARGSADVFVRMERFFPLLELALIVVFLALLVTPGTLSRTLGFPWFILWAVALMGLLPGIIGAFRSRSAATSSGAVVMASTQALAWASVLVLVGILALRAAVIFSAQ
jgi:formate-dependent nitrite reductase membrane component NrfD